MAAHSEILSSEIDELERQLASVAAEKDQLESAADDDRQTLHQAIQVPSTRLSYMLTIL